jgi:hypothetical protein
LRIYGQRDGVTRAVAGASIQFTEARASHTVAAAAATILDTVSAEDGDHVPAQITDAESFLATHHAEIVRILAQPDVDGGYLDFGWEVPHDAVAQFNRWPRSLLGACSEIGLALDVSVYVVENQRPSN